MSIFLPSTSDKHTQTDHKTPTNHWPKKFHKSRCERLTERAKDLLDLGAVDLLAAVLVEDFEAFDVVLFAAGIGGDSLRLRQNWVEIRERDPLGT